MENNNLNPSPVTAYQPPSDPISPTTTPPPSPVVANPTIPNTIPNPTAYSPVIPASQTPGVTPNPSTQVPLTPEPIPSLEQAPPIMPPPPQAPNQMINPPLAQSTGKPNGWKVGVIVAVVLLLVTGVVSAVKMNQSKDVSKRGTTTTNQAGAKVNKIDEKKFQTDSDGDSLPDFIEKEWGYDPNSDDVLKCYENKCLDPSIQAGQIKKT